MKILLASPARRFLKNAETGLRSRLLEKIAKLGEDPFPADSKRVIGRREKIFRVRVGDYRITYAVFWDKKELLIIDIDKRSRAYD
jgi:mRNA interferase RelE/StbE